MQILAIKDIFELPSQDDFDAVYFVTEMMDTDLYRIIRSSQVFIRRILGGEPVYFFRQLTLHHRN